MRTGALILALQLAACRGNGVEPETARVQAFDALVRPGGDVVLRAKAEKLGTLLIHPDLHGVPLVFRAAGGAEIGRASTGDDGIASVRFAAPARVRRDLRVEVAFAEGCGFVGEPSSLRVAVRDGARPMLVCDIDHTICDAAALEIPFKDPTEIPELPGASAVLRRLASTYDVLYVTARDDAYVERTRRWLAYHRFPAGPVFHHDLELTALSAGSYKRDRVADLKRDWPSLVVGVGDRTADAEAYLASGLRAILIGDEDLPAGAERVDSWAEIERRIGGDTR